MIRITLGALLFLLGQAAGVAMAWVTVEITRSFPKPMVLGQYAGVGAIAVLTFAFIALTVLGATDLVIAGLLARKRRRGRA